jgi:hypothetical protein
MTARAYEYTPGDRGGSSVGQSSGLIIRRSQVQVLPAPPDELVSEADWSWVLLQLADEGLPVVKVPRSPQRLALQWQQFFDAITERRLTHDSDPVLARHAGNLALISGPSGLRPDLDVSEGAPIAAALACMVAFDGVARVGPPEELGMILPSGVG